MFLTNLKTLSDFLDEHIAICSESVRGQYGLVRPGFDRLYWSLRRLRRQRHVQTKDFGGISSLNAISLALARVACDDTEVGASNGKYSSSILAIRIEMPLLGLPMSRGRE
jgi:hypothetical protein